MAILLVAQEKKDTNTADAAETALSDFKNSFDNSKAAIVTSGTPEQGQVAIVQTGSEIVKLVLKKMSF